MMPSGQAAYQRHREEPDAEKTFLALYELELSREDACTYYDAETGFEEFCRHALRGSSILLFIRGHASSRWRTALCEKFKIDPDFTASHLQQDSDETDVLNTFSQSPLPSSAQKSVRLWTSTTISLLSNVKANGGQRLVEKRASAAEAMFRFRSSMSHLRSGQPVVRQCYTVNERESVIDQAVSFTCCSLKEKKGWAVIVWGDQSRDVTASIALLDSKIGLSHQPYFTYAGQLPPSTELGNTTDISCNDARSQRCFALAYGRSELDWSLMSQDVLYTLSALFSTTARSENQLLELLHDQVMREASSSVEDDNALANLRYLKVIIDGRLERLQALRFALRSISLQGWPTSEAETVRNSKQRIRYDYEHLEQRASRLTENCTTAIAGLINQLVFAVAQEGLRNSVQVERLTLLATIFIPITFTCTFFGMNFAEFGTGTAPIWIFPVVLGGVALISVLLYYFRSTFAKRQNHLSLVL